MPRSEPRLALLLLAAALTSAPAVGAPPKAAAPPAPKAPAGAPPSAPAPAAGLDHAAHVDDAKDVAADQHGEKKKRPERDANTCLSCHLTLSESKLRVVAEQYARSAHRDERIGCAACHKGNPLDPTVQAHEKGTGFVVRPTHQQIATLCGSCHEDPTFVRRFNARLPVDQARLFELSRHGKIAGAGDAHAPTCSTCHGTHDIQPVATPTAPVNRRHVVSLCEKCHGDAEYMKPYGLAANQPDKWRKSVHGLAFAQGSETAPACTGCHSPHAGTLPGTATVSALCDRCHQDERELFLKSPHARAFRKLGLPDCVPCHGEHDVARSSWLAGMAPDSACSKCHSQDARPKEVATQVARLLTEVEQDEHSVGVAISDARKGGLFMPEAQFALDQLHTARVRLIATVHTLDLPRLEEERGKAKALAQEAAGSVQAAQQARELERRGYFAAVFVSTVLFALLVAKALQVRGRRTRSGP